MILVCIPLLGMYSIVRGKGLEYATDCIKQISGEIIGIKESIGNNRR